MLLCGFCPNEGTPELSINPNDFPFSHYDDSFDNYVMEMDLGIGKLALSNFPKGHEDLKLELQRSGQTYCSS